MCELLKQLWLLVLFLLTLATSRIIQIPDA